MKFETYYFTYLRMGQCELCELCKADTWYLLVHCTVLKIDLCISRIERIMSKIVQKFIDLYTSFKSTNFVLRATSLIKNVFQTKRKHLLKHIFLILAY